MPLFFFLSLLGLLDCRARTKLMPCFSLREMPCRRQLGGVEDVSAPADAGRVSVDAVVEGSAGGVDDCPEPAAAAEAALSTSAGRLRVELEADGGEGLGGGAY